MSKNKNTPKADNTGNFNEKLVECVDPFLDAAETLISEARTPAETTKLQLLVERFDNLDHYDTASLTAASPYVEMTTGQTKTLLEMMAEDESDLDQTRLAYLLLRSLEWKLPR